MPETLLPNVRKLLSERPITKMGQIQAAWPEIRQAIQAGHTLKTICERLRADGVDIQDNRLSEYIGRLRRRHSRPAAHVESAPSQAGKGGAELSSVAGRQIAGDVTANLRGRLDRSSGFVYGGTGKKEDLV
jgi:hypothetical protein